MLHCTMWDGAKIVYVPMIKQSDSRGNKALWMFNLLSDCNTVAEINETKNKYYPQMKHTDINELQELFDY